MELKKFKFFDLHIDTPLKYYRKSREIDVDINSVKEFNKYIACFAAFVRDDESAYNTAKNIIFEFKKSGIPIIKKRNDLKNKTAGIFTLENGSSLLGSEEVLEEFVDLGVKAFTLTWNGENNLASGAFAEGGIKPLGKKIIKKANRLGLPLDLSHLNREGFMQAVEMADNPFVSHTAYFEAFAHKRNVCTDMVRRIALKNGVVGICFYPEFLGSGNVFENFYRHIFMLLENGFEDNICIGSDFDGADMDEMLNSPQKAAQLYEYLKERGIEGRILDKIFFLNAERFFERIIK